MLVALLALLLLACVPSNLAGPVCVLPPPMVTDSTTVPLGCPYMLPDSTVHGGL